MASAPARQRALFKVFTEIPPKNHRDENMELGGRSVQKCKEWRRGAFKKVGKTIWRWPKRAMQSHTHLEFCRVRQHMATPYLKGAFLRASMSFSYLSFRRPQGSLERLRPTPALEPIDFLIEIKKIQARLNNFFSEHHQSYFYLIIINCSCSTLSIPSSNDWPNLRSVLCHLCVTIGVCF